jgi:hypothetical protein
MLCPLCRQRKARRACPALGQQICAVCCGTKRLVEIQCPETCPYLATAREHPPAVVQREQQRDVAAMMHTMRDVTERQQQLMFLLLGVARRYEGDALQSAVDADLADAARSLASTLETANRGVIYEHQPGTMAAQRLVTDWKALFKDISSREGGDRLLQRDGPIALRAIERGAADLGRVLPGGERAYLQLVARMLRPRAGEGSPEPSAEATKSSGLILPPD